MGNKPDKPLRDFLASGTTIVSDGGMGTSLYDKGFFVNRSFEELCLKSPDAVEEVVQEFKDAGAQLLGTNTFSANVPKLSEYGLQDKLEKIIEKAVEINRTVGKDEAYVIGSMGPLGLVLEPLGPTSVDDAQEHFKQVATALEKADVDGFSLETFHDLNELESAVRAVRSVSSKPIFAYISVQENMKTSYGHSLREFVRRFDHKDIDVLGLNCQLGPHLILSGIEKLHTLTEKPLAVLPNAGLPRFVNDRYVYLCNPDYLGKFAKRFVQAGAQIVGGCCGTNNYHIKAISNALRMLDTTSHKQKARPRVDTVGLEVADPLPMKERSKLGAALEAGERVFSVELVPPVGVSIEKFMNHCQALKDGGISFVNIPDGARAVARMSSLHLSALVKREIGLEPIPHFTSRDRNLIGLQSDLLGAFINGVHNVLLVTGDPPKLGNCPDATAVYDVDAIGLTHIVNRMNHGLDLGGSPFGKPTDYVVGVALNPTAINQELEMKRYGYKVEAGANFAITQPIYDLESYTQFFDKRGASEIPVVMGIWPLVSLRNAEFLKYEVPGVSVPDWVLKEMEKAGDNREEGIKRGFEIAIKTMQEAKDIVAGFQVSAPFNKVKVALDVIQAL